jgi:hypothetical protein
MAAAKKPRPSLINQLPPIRNVDVELDALPIGYRFQLGGKVFSVPVELPASVFARFAARDPDNADDENATQLMIDVLALMVRSSEREELDQAIMKSGVTRHLLTSISDEAMAAVLGRPTVPSAP